MRLGYGLLCVGVNRGLEFGTVGSMVTLNLMNFINNANDVSLLALEHTGVSPGFSSIITSARIKNPTHFPRRPQTSVSSERGNRPRSHRYSSDRHIPKPILNVTLPLHSETPALHVLLPLPPNLPQMGLTLKLVSAESQIWIPGGEDRCESGLAMSASVCSVSVSIRGEVKTKEKREEVYFWFISPCLQLHFRPHRHHFQIHIFYMSTPSLSSSWRAVKKKKIKLTKKSWIKITLVTNRKMKFNPLITLPIND